MHSYTEHMFQQDLDFLANGHNCTLIIFLMQFQSVLEFSNPTFFDQISIDHQT